MAIPRDSACDMTESVHFTEATDGLRGYFSKQLKNRIAGAS